MKTKKIEDFTIGEIKEICKKQKRCCEGCPFIDIDCPAPFISQSILETEIEVEEE